MYLCVVNNHTNMEIILPRGLRNHNPLNIRKSAATWKGMTQNQPDKSFVTFQSNEYGYRAAFKLIRTYQTKYKCNCIRKIIERWAPPCENHTANYIKEVSRMSGIGPDVIVYPSDEEAMVAIVHSMAIVENGLKYLDYIEEHEIREGYHLAF